MKVDIMHIHPQSGSSDSGYLNEIYLKLKDKYSQVIITNYYNTICEKNCYRCFFKNTDTESGKFVNRDSLFFFFCTVLELFYGYIYSLRLIKRYRPRVINFSLTSSRFVVLFMWLIRIVSRKTKIVITCHDATEPMLYGIRKIFSINYKRVYLRADALLVHNKECKDALIKNYAVPKEKIFMHCFPLKGKKVDFEIKEKKERLTFALVGVLNPYKGVEFVVGSWKEDFRYNNTCQLILGGKVSGVSDSVFGGLEDIENVELHLQYLSEQEYDSLLYRTDYMLLPYKTCGNSGILFDCLTMGCIPVTSGLEVFINNEFVQKNCIIEKLSEKAVTEKIRYLCEGGQKLLNEFRVKQQKLIDEYEREFEEQTIRCYSDLFLWLFKEKK